MQYAQLIRGYLDGSGLSVEAFAAQADISRATVFRILAGSENMELKTLKKALSTAGYTLAAVRAFEQPPARRRRG